VLIAHFILERIERKKKTNRKRRAGTQSRPCRQIGYVMDLNTIVDTQELQAAADGRMLNSSIVANVFYLRVGYPAVIFEEGWKLPASDVTTLVNSSCQDRSTVLAVPDRIVRATTEK
jgi:hypothetical protein